MTTDSLQDDLRQAVITERTLRMHCVDQDYPQPTSPEAAQAALTYLLADLRLLAGVMGMDFDKALADSR